MAVLTPITQIGNRKYFICDTFANLTSQNPKWSGALCRVDDGTWYEFREFAEAGGTGTWEVYDGEPITFSLGGTAVSESNPLPIKTSLLSATPVTVFNAISATPATPFSIPLEGTGIKEIKIITSGTSTSRTLTFKAKLNSADTATPFMGVNFSNPSDALAIQTTGQGEIWSFSGFDGVCCLEFNVSAIAGGNFTVKAEYLS